MNVKLADLRQIPFIYKTFCIFTPGIQAESDAFLNK